MKLKILLLILFLLCMYLAESGEKQTKKVTWEPNYGVTEVIEYDYKEDAGRERVNLYLRGEIIANVDMNCLTPTKQTELFKI